jgi:hypothetical protein
MPVTIDHEPLKQRDSRHENSRDMPTSRAIHTDSQTGVFGKRRKTAAPSSAITGTFFEPSGLESGFRKQKIRYLSPGHTVSSRLPLRTLAAVFTIAFALPATFVTLSERQLRSDIDPITTASIDAGSDQLPIRVSDVTITKILKSGTSVITVFGKVQNRSKAEVRLHELEIVLLDETGRNIQSWFHRMGKSSIGSDQTFRFMSSAIDITGDAKSAVVKPVQ